MSENSPQRTSPEAKLMQAETLAKSVNAWDGTPYHHYPAGQPEITVLRLSIRANTTLPWHSHPMPSVTHVLSGSITLEHRATGKKKTIHAGDTLTEWMDDEHRGFTGDEDCVVINFYAGAKDLPLSIPAAGEAPEMP